MQTNNMAASIRSFIYILHARKFLKMLFKSSNSLRCVASKNHNFVRRYSNKEKIDSYKYCFESVRKYDYENYLCCLLLPESVRPAAFVIRAFNIEISHVRDSVSTAALGEMRLKFWQNALNKTYAGNPPEQPVAQELYKENLLSDKAFLTINELEDYCDKSVATVYFLILQSLEAANLQTDHISSHLGRCQGICNFIRGIPYNASKRRVFLPMELMSKHKVSENDVIQGIRSQNLQDAVYELSSVAHQHLILARELSKEVSHDVKPVFLPAVASAAYLSSLEKTDFDVFHQKNQRRNNWLPVSLLYHKLLRTF